MICSLSLRSALSWVKHGRFVPLGILLLMPALAQAQSKGIDDPQPKDKKPAGDAQVEVRFTDGGIMKLGIRDEQIEFLTPYGKLYIPVAEVKRIEFALRVPDDVSKRIEAAVADLGNSQFRRRETASTILLNLREKAYPAVLKATKNSDMEIANRAEELVKKFKENVPAELLQPRELDVIHTEHSKISGKIETATFRANTTQFGEVPLRLSDIHQLSVKGLEPEPDSMAVAAGPINMVQFQNEIGKTFSFRVTGNTGGSLWGTDLYTTDSTLATAAVHVGLLQPGQTGVVKVAVVASPQVFVGSVRNGVGSAAYGQYPAAYRVFK